MKLLPIARLLALLSLIAVPASAIAQGPGGLSFQATLESIKVDAQPGQVLTRQFRLTLDPNQRETRFKARIEDWWRSEDGTQSFFGEPGKLRHSCGRWVSLNPVLSAVRPGETLTIRISVAIPGEMASGGYWCVLTVDEIPDPAVASTGPGVRFIASVSTGIFVNVGTVERSARILEVDVAAEQAFIKLRNEGNTPVGIDGRLEFYAPGTTTPTATVVVPRGTILTEPSVNGTLTAILPPAADLPSGRYRVRAILDYGASHFIGAEKEIELLRGTSAIPVR
jgi:hypothetical protein